MLPRLVVFFIFVLLPNTAFGQLSEPREAFSRGYAHYAAGRASEAKELFRGALTDDFPLADYSLYYLALIAFGEGDADQAKQHSGELRQRFPQSLWVQAAGLLEAKLAIVEKNHARAIEVLTQLRADKFLKSEIAEEGLFLQAQAREAQGELQRAYALYEELRDRAPTSRWTGAARKAQANLREKHGDLFPFQTAQSLAEEADRLVRERQTLEAETLYKKLLNNAVDAETRLRFLGKLSSLYLSVRNRTEAMPLLERIAREFPHHPEDARALYQIGQILWNRHDNSEALKYFRAVIDKYPASSYADRSLYAAGDIHEYFGRRDQA